MRLPPLNALRAFEAAARHSGFGDAAEELHVTRGAVSRHVKLLEEHLGVALFRRHARGVSLTLSGERLLPVLTRAFADISRTAESLAAEASDLRIICPPATSIRWLIPRLETFRQRHPHLKVRLTTDFHGDLGFDASEFDLGFSVEEVPGRPATLEVLPLFPIMLSPACAPALLDRAPALSQPSDLARHTLLHETPRREDWRAWITAFGIAGVDPATGNAFPNLDMALRAATMGAGVVIADLVLSHEELSQGTLVLPFRDMICDAPSGDICLIGARDRWHEPKIRAFRDWVAEEAAGSVDRL